MKHIMLFLVGIGLLIALLMHFFPGRIDMHDNGPHLVQLVLIGTLLCSGALFAYRNRVGEAFRHGFIWVGLMFLLVLGYSFKDQLVATLVPGKTHRNAEGELITQKADDGHFYLELGINAVPVRMMVDTGASSIVLDADTARRINMDTSTLRYTAEVSTANGRTFTAPVTLPLVTFAGKQFLDVPVFVAQEGALKGPLLGMNFLKRFARFSIEGDQMVIAP